MYKHKVIIYIFYFSCEISQNLNEEQKIAVTCIVEQTSRPIPFLLFGPPGKQYFISPFLINKFSVALGVFFFEKKKSTIGTGKTKTIVAAIAEIVRTSKNNVLVCAQSNAACDEITNRLVNVLHKGEISRMYAKSWNINAVNSNIRPISNFRNSEFQFPSLNYIYRHRVVVTTLLTAGCFPRLRSSNSARYDSGHFSHIFIDEAGFVHEPISLIAIAGNLN